MRTKKQERNTRRKKIMRYSIVAGLCVAALILVTAAGVYVWARMSIGSSLLARAILWGDSDVDDWQRFPARVISASDEPYFFTVDDPVSFPGKFLEDQGTFYSLEEYLEGSDTTAFIILFGDKLVYEAYFNGASRESTVTSMSTSKSFVSTIVGIAIAEGYIGSLDDPVTDYIPELFERDPRFAEITLRHLLTMSSGLRFERKANGIDDGTISYYAPDLRAAALDSQIVEAPGIRFWYNDYNPLLVGVILERATGMSVSEYLEKRLWQPMGAEADGSWSLDSEHSGFEKMSTGINGRAIDFVKLGWLYLNEGRIGDQQVVPTEWVENSTSLDNSKDPALDYQYFWWVGETQNVYWADGDKCQYIYVSPEFDLVIARFGRSCGDKPNFGPVFLRNFTAMLGQQLAN